MAVVKNLLANLGDARDAGSFPGLGRSPGVGNGKSHQYSCLENSMDRGAWQAIVPVVPKSRTHTHRQQLTGSYNIGLTHDCIMGN